MNYIKNKEDKISNILNELGYDDDVRLIPSSKREFGMYQYNGAMNMAKKYHKSPLSIASEITNKLKFDEDLVNINIQGSGFINISFSTKYLSKYINELLKDVHSVIEKKDTKKIVIDYGGANVAKTLHVGHLRSANIGEALKRLAILCGYSVISDVHLGDYGRQMGMIMLEIKKRQPNLVYFDDNYKGEYPKTSPITNKDLEIIYPLANAKCKEDEKYLEEARDITNKLQQHHPGYTALWHHIVNASVKDIKRLYNSLNTSFDYWYGESDAYQYIDDISKYLDSKGILTKSDGAVIIDVSESDDNRTIPPLLLFKSNGAVSYEATDLATIWQRIKDFNPSEIWYVVDNRQELHFTQTFRAAYKSGIVSSNVKLEFLGFGTMNGKDGKPFKTRSGGVMPLEELMKEVKNETLKRVSQDILNKDEVATIVATATVKYADLLPTRSKDYIFDIEKFCDMQGKTGPYILYSTVRIKSLLNKASKDNYNFINIYNKEEENIVLNLLNLNNVIMNSLKNKSLSDICEYLFKLNNAYNNFYNENRIISEIDKDKKDSYLAISMAVYKVNLLLLDVLAIDVPERM